jgi:hypothetical protein
MRPFAAPTPFGFGSNADRPPISVPSMQTGNKLFRRRPGSSSGRLTPLVRSCRIPPMAVHIYYLAHSKWWIKEFLKYR